MKDIGFDKIRFPVPYQIPASTATQDSTMRNTTVLSHKFKALVDADNRKILAEVRRSEDSGDTPEFVRCRVHRVIAAYAWPAR